MIGLVMVSHSDALARAAIELAEQMVHEDRPPVRIASGVEGGFGTDAAAIAEAVDDLSDCEGVLIMTDLGSAVLSSELALDIRESTHPVRISDGPFVEGTTAGFVRAATGGSLDEVAAEARRALDAKRREEDGDASAGADSAPVAADTASTSDAGGYPTEQAPLRNPMGMHSRPAALIVKAAGQFISKVQVTNVTANKGPVRADSMIGLLSLGAGKDDVLSLTAEGPDAAEAVAAVYALVLDGFGEV